MAKIVDSSFFYKIILFSIFLIIISCSSIKIVTIKNSTNEIIKFRGQFFYKPYESYNLDFTLNPGDIDSWDYEIGFLKKNTLDIGLKNIILTNEKCTVVLKRNVIEEIAKINGMWEINIDENIMKCN